MNGGLWTVLFGLLQLASPTECERHPDPEWDPFGGVFNVTQP